MSDNPFHAPQSYAPTSPPPGGQGESGEAPLWFTLAAVFSMVIGVLGFLSNCLGAGGLIVMMAIARVDPDSPIANNPAQSGPVMAVNILFMLLALPIAVGLFACSLGVLNRKTWGLRGLIWFSLLGCIFVIARLAVAIPVQILSVEEVQTAQGIPEEMATFLFVAGLIFNVVVTAALAVFYFYNYKYFQRDEIRRLFVS